MPEIMVYFWLNCSNLVYIFVDLTIDATFLTFLMGFFFFFFGHTALNYFLSLISLYVLCSS